MDKEENESIQREKCKGTRKIDHCSYEHPLNQAIKKLMNHFLRFGKHLGVSFFK